MPSRRSILATTGAVIVAAAVGGNAASRRGAASVASEKTADAGPPAPPLVRSTGTIESAAAPSAAWTYTAGDYIRDLRYADGRVYIMTLSSIVALDSATGRELWHIPLVSAASTLGDAHDDGVFYTCGSVGLSAPEALMAIDAATGATLWSLAAPPNVAFSSVSRPLDGAVYVTVYDNDSKQREVWAVDAATRSVRWKTPCAFQSDSVSTYAPIGGSTVFNCDSRGSAVTAFDAASGKTTWQSQEAVCCLTDDSGSIVISSDATSVSGLDAATGAVVWQNTLSAGSSNVAPSVGGFEGGGPVAGQTSAFADGSDVYYVWDGANFKAYKAGDAGTVLWSAALNPGGLFENISVVFDENDTLFISGGYLFAVDTRSGGCRWQFPAARGGAAAQQLVMNEAPVAAGGGYCYTTPDPIMDGKVLVALAIAATPEA